MKKSYISAEEAVKLISSGDRVFVHSVAAAPHHLLEAMTHRADELRDVEVISLHTEGPAPYTDPEYKDSFTVNALFVGANVRKAVNEGRGDYLPIFLSETPYLFRNNILPLDVALVHVSPPDKHGFCSLGVSVDASRAAVQTAKKVIAQVNPRMPRTHGDGMVHVKEFDAVVEHENPLPEHFVGEPGEIEQKIGNYCAELVENGATLQMGIGGIPNAVLRALKNHKNLGIHTEMFSDGIIDLVKSGVINNKKKKRHPGKIVSTFLMGSQKLYDFVDDNPQVAMLDVAYTNDTAVIRKNPKVTAINSAVEVDLTGQVCADSIGTYHYSGVGGQMDFIRGASLSEGGKPIIALPSVTSKGISRIVPYLKQGAGVVTTRAHVHYVVTEYGVANLYGKNMSQRAKALIEIAHPDHKEKLEEEAYNRFLEMP
ncbi:4-hydroxybutyrate CoA-transferase [Aliifodinibius sp. S!AR15-10]|uniref:acetyl-CoA hydrolase/transferase family protein n=1 Tax=Aliifodinibius sp. S!AR15-10 TaxID=2950437 RepID=UPI00285FC8BB|nr:acetyl-CoA hydrolase/transferase C-terminal domain-containing protein [Aliifodinibius sp. S!AR15-10]MDR8393167.1 4-hydroxybutyrate CoA-transferase [Aliifodinibius sp. S!AR15-10]